MTEKDKNQEMEKQQDSTASDEAVESRATGAGDGGHSGSGLSILALLISLGAAAGSGWLWYHQQGANVAVNQTVGKVEQAQKETSEKLVALNTEFNAEKNQTAKALTEAASKQAALEGSLKQIYIDISNNRDVWKLEEVDQLLTVAGERMQLANDRKTALAALQLADKRLATMGDPALLPLREKVTDAIGKLKALGGEDVSGVALKIRSLIKQVDALPFDYDRKPGAAEKTSFMSAPLIVYAAEDAAPAVEKAEASAPTEQAIPEVTAPAENVEPAETAKTDNAAPASEQPATDSAAESAAEAAPAASDAPAEKTDEVVQEENVSTEQAGPTEQDAVAGETAQDVAPAEPDAAAAPAPTEAEVVESEPETGPATESATVVETAPAQPEPAVVVSPADDSGSGVQPVLKKLKQGASAFFDELWSDTKKAFDYQVLDRAARPLLTPDQKYFATENVKLALGAAQLAALQGDEVTYKDNLEKARQWIGQYFAADNAQVQAAVDAIAELEKVDVSPEWPDISGVLQELRVIKERKAGQ